MRVYKFLPAEFAIKDIRERRLKISTIQQTNDPFELAALRLVDNGKINPFLIRFFNENYIPAISTFTGMMCFTAKWESPVLWAHYAENHKGIVLGFEIKDGAAELRKVTYVRKKKKRDITFILEAMTSALRENRPVERTDPFASQAVKIFREMLSTKFVDWEYEREIRTFAEVKEKEGDHYFFGFGDHTRLMEVILGARCDTEAGKILKEVADYPDQIRVVRAIPSQNDFKMLEDKPKTVIHTPPLKIPASLL